MRAMVEKKRRYQPSNARRPDLSAQGEGMLLLITQAVDDLAACGVDADSHIVLTSIAEQLSQYQSNAGNSVEPTDPYTLAKTAIVEYAEHWLATAHAAHIATIRMYVPTLVHANLSSEQELVEALMQAGVSPKGSHRSKNPVAVAVTNIRHLTSVRQKFSKINYEAWENIYKSAFANLPFKTWPERIEKNKEYTFEELDSLAYGLVLVESQRHLGLIWQITRKMAGSYPEHSERDMFGWGWRGLCLALRSYEPTTAAFSTYAAQRINGSVRDGVRSEAHLPKRLTAKVRAITVAEEDLTQDLGRSPSLEELASHVGATLMELEISRSRYQAPASLDEILETSNNDSYNESWMQETYTDPAESAVASVRAEEIAVAVGELPKEQRDAVRLLIFEGLTTTEAAERTGLSARQIRRHRDLGLAAIAESLESWVQ